MRGSGHLISMLSVMHIFLPVRPNTGILLCGIPSRISAAFWSCISYFQIGSISYGRADHIHLCFPMSTVQDQWQNTSILGNRETLKRELRAAHMHITSNLLCSIHKSAWPFSTELSPFVKCHFWCTRLWNWQRQMRKWWLLISAG